MAEEQSGLRAKANTHTHTPASEHITESKSQKRAESGISGCHRNLICHSSKHPLAARVQDKTQTDMATNLLNQIISLIHNYLYPTVGNDSLNPCRLENSSENLHCLFLGALVMVNNAILCFYTAKALNGLASDLWLILQQDKGSLMVTLRQQFVI